MLVVKLEYTFSAFYPFFRFSAFYPFSAFPPFTLFSAFPPFTLFPLFHLLPFFPLFRLLPFFPLFHLLPFFPLFRLLPFFPLFHLLPFFPLFRLLPFFPFFRFRVLPLPRYSCWAAFMIVMRGWELMRVASLVFAVNSSILDQIWAGYNFDECWWELLLGSWRLHEFCTRVKFVINSIQQLQWSVESVWNSS